MLPAFFFALGRVCREVAVEALQAVPAEPKRSATPSSGPKKRIVLLMDGTGATEEGGSNVRKLYLCLAKDGGELPQVAFYNAGAPDTGEAIFGSVARDALNAFGLATGYFHDEQVLEGYRFLVENYRAGDEVFLFGFGRGAYAARAIAGFIHTIGLLPPERIDSAPAGLAAYKTVSEDTFVLGTSSPSALFARAMETRTVPIRFVGVWDTVAPVLIPRSDRIFIPSLLPLRSTRANLSVQSFRQAMAIDERRRMFRPYHWNEPQRFMRQPNDVGEQDIKQVWFAGSHADVGGGYPEQESGLSKYPLLWMIGEAVSCGLMVDLQVVERLVGGRLHTTDRASFSPPDFRSTLHDPLTASWRIIEFLPKASQWKEWPARRSLFGFYIPDGEPRFVPENALVHASVVRRIEAMPNYRPVNLPSRYNIVEGTGWAMEDVTTRQNPAVA
ncbi:DUF2235 domain-containing protein [Bradyrhizobium sp. 200]|nr:DUF2235 domain-containing protein [Bradyrhizobium sp. 200]